MERNRIRSRARLISSTTASRIGVTRGLALALALLLPVGCVNALDKARIAWSDGEGDFDEAEELYRDAIDHEKYREEGTQELVEIYLQQAREQRDRPKVAESLYKKALKLDPNNEEALEGRARALIGRGMPDEAFALVEEGSKTKCRGCKRLLAVLLIDRADRYYHAQMWPQAEADYSRALAIIPNAAVALGVVRCRIARGATEEAAQALAPAADLIGVQDVDQRGQFLELRRIVVLAVLAADKPELADRLLDMAPAGVGAEEQLGLAIEVAYELKKLGKTEIALDRLETLVKHAEEGKLKVSAERVAELRERLAGLYIARSAQRLAKNEVPGADEDLARALELRPADPSLQLQRVLAIAGKGKLPDAEAALGKIDPSTGGYAQVWSILLTIRVHDMIASGRIDAAREQLERAKSKTLELPEVHIATADLLRHTEVNLRKKDAAALRSTGLVKYPGGKITRLGEALSELDWSKQSVSGLGAAYPYRAPGSEQKLEGLRTDIAKDYPFAVKFAEKAEATLVLKNNRDEPVTATVKCGSFDAEAKLAPSSSSRVQVSKPGFCELNLGGKAVTYVAEPYTEVEIPL
ncbi:MAG: hypothetical protein IPK74_20760 [Deltaproteobacteria bacterium]|nr:hypothetical protein [Deltaproteobacteria bacterium]